MFISSTQCLFQVIRSLKSYTRNWGITLNCTFYDLLWHEVEQIFIFICFAGECVQEIFGLTAYEYGCGDWKCVLLIGKWMGNSRRALKVDLFVILEFFNSIIYLVGFIRAELASRLRTYVFNVEMCCARAFKSGKNRLNTSLWPKSLTWAFSKQKILQI